MALTHRHIEVFRALMTAGSVTKAAQLLFTSQPTISRELARVEQVVGFALFDREKGRLRPTLPALMLFDEIKRSYEGLERIASTAASLRTFKDGQLSIITLPAFAHAMLPGTCARFHRHHPGISVSISAQESPFLEEWLSAQRYDLGLTEHGQAPAGTTLVPLLEVDEVCVLPDGHRLLKQSVVGLADLHDENFISLSATDPYRSQLDEDFLRLGVARRMVAEAPTAVSVCSLVRHGLGVAIVNPLTALDFEGRNLHIRPLSVSYPFRISIVLPQHRPGSPLVDAFVTALRQEAAHVLDALNNFKSTRAKKKR